MGCVSCRKEWLEEKAAHDRLLHWLRTFVPGTNLEERLTELNLAQKQLLAIPPEFGRLRNLRVLNLEENQLFLVPPELGKMAALEKLLIQKNQLAAIPMELGQLALLEHLDLSENQLALVPPQLGRLASLHRLDLQENSLDAVPGELGQLRRLQKLYLWKNQLWEIPPELGELTELRVLGLEENNLTTIPPELGRLLVLEYLGLERNRLEHLPPELGQLESLKELGLDHNQLQRVPSELGQLAALEFLLLGHNRLEAVPTELNGLAKLITLEIQGNGIRGPFNLQDLFQRLANDDNAELQLSGNSFEPVDFGDAAWTTGELHDPLVLDAGSPSEKLSVCTASFCGAEYLDWQLLLARSRRMEAAERPLWSHLCVFQEEYATAADRASAPSHWHAGGLGSRDCRALGRYFRAADEYTGGRASDAHDRFGCCWFRQWRCNVDAALQKGHRRFVVFTKTDRTVGVCQTVEWLHLLKAKKRHPDLEVHCVSVSDSMLVLQFGPLREAFNGRCGYTVFDRPLGLPAALSIAQDAALGP